MKNYEVTLVAHYAKTVSIHADSPEQAAEKLKTVLFDTDLVRFSDGDFVCGEAEINDPLKLISHDLDALPLVGEAPASPAMGTLYLQLAFESWWTPVVYIIGFIALWFHMNHGFWSMFHTIGWDNNIWIKRLKTIGCWWTTIVVALFVAQAVVFTVLSHKNYYTTDEALQEQYAEYWGKQAETVMTDFQDGIAKAFQACGENRAAILRTAQNNPHL